MVAHRRFGHLGRVVVLASRGLQDAVYVKRERTVGTILEHAREAQALGLLPAEVLERLGRGMAEVTRAVAPLFKKQAIRALKPVYEHFKGQYSYGDLKIADWLLSQVK